MKKEQTLKTRREFLHGTVLGGALSWTLPSFLAQTFNALQTNAANAAVAPVTGRDGTILVVLQMAGGNDGLNTVVPFANDHYVRARPKLHLTADRVLKLGDQLGLHPALRGLRDLYDQGNVGIIQGVGYPNPNRSHFRSTEIWQTASDAKKFERHGWIGRFFDHACKGCDPTAGISVGRQMPQAFAGPHPVGISLEDPNRYRYITGDRPESDEEDTNEKSYRMLNGNVMSDEDASAGDTIGSVPGRMVHSGSALDFLERTALDAQMSSDTIRAISQNARTSGNYPAGRLGSALRLVASLIGGGLSTRVFYVSQGGYDTHTNQAGAHERLLQEMGDAVKAFVDDMKAQGNFERVLLMTFSEFGRRVKENASTGTDHGAAAPLFMVGPKIKAGLVGSHPDLAPDQLLNGDPRFTADFRGVIAEVLENWLRTPSAPILGRRFEPVKVLA